MIIMAIKLCDFILIFYFSINTLQLNILKISIHHLHCISRLDPYDQKYLHILKLNTSPYLLHTVLIAYYIIEKTSFYVKPIRNPQKIVS